VKEFKKKINQILHCSHSFQSKKQGRAIAQTFSLSLPTAAARVQARGFVVDKVALGQVFSEYFNFPCQSSFHQISPQSSSPIIRGWYNRPVVAAVPKAPQH
jgi:hypothetical protein